MRAPSHPHRVRLAIEIQGGDGFGVTKRKITPGDREDVTVQRETRQLNLAAVKGGGVRK